MSGAFCVIFCDACTYRTHSLIAVGSYFWRSGDREFRFRSGLGVCETCRGVVAIELFPSPELFEQARERRRSWMRRHLIGFGRDQIGTLASQDGFEVLEEVIALRREPVCLSCGQPAFVTIDRGKLHETSDKTERPLGIAHPGCSGNLRIRGSGLNRISMAEITRVFDPRGKMIAKRFGRE